MLAWPEAPPLELDDFVRVPSFDMHGELALSLARRVIEHAGRGDLAGVVIAHGTDTMEESVFLIDRLLGSDMPVVLTGAQRGADETDTDGPRNLRDAIRVASAPEARGRGAMIAFAGELHAAREVRKVHTSALRAFAAPGYGPIGRRRRRARRVPATPREASGAAGAAGARPRRPDPALRRQRRALRARRRRVGSESRRARGDGPRQRQRPGRRRASATPLRAGSRSPSARAASTVASSPSTAAAAGATWQRRAPSSQATSRARRRACCCRSRSAPALDPAATLAAEAG